MELWKNDGRATRIVKMHPEFSRRGKPCSKIEAKLRSRRQSKLEIEEKKEASISKRTPKNSSSESEISPRFFTSKQRVELVNFQSPKIVPLLPKYSRNLCEIETKNSSINQSKNSLGQRINDNALSSRRETSGIKKVDNKEFGKRRSRSAPCTTPLFKIKCSKDKFPRDIIVDGKSLAAGETREKMGNYGRSVPLSLRISRSGDVSVSSRERSSNERIIDRSGSGEPEARPEEYVEANELFLFVRKSKNLEINMATDNNTNDRTYSVEDFATSECSEKVIIETEEEIIEAGKIITVAENKLIYAEERFIEVKKESTNFGKGTTEIGEKINEAKKDAMETEEKNMKYEEEKKVSVETNESQENCQVFSKNLTTIENVTNTVANGENQCSEDNEGAEEIVKKKSPSAENLENKEQKVIAEEYSSPRKFPKKREFQWETILEKQYRRTDGLICDAVNSKKSMGIIENVEADKFKFWTEKAANDSTKNAPPKWRNAFEEKKLEAYRVIKQELPKLFMKRQISDAMKNKRVCEGAKNSEQADKSNTQISKNAEIISKPTTINVEFPKRMSKEDFRSRIMKFENLADNEAAQKNTTQKNEGPKNSRPSILKRRKSPSPRRVTFRLPGRFIDDEAFEEKMNVTGKIVGDAIELDSSSEPVEQFTEKIGQYEKVQNLRDKQKCGRRDGCNCCAQGRARKVQPNKLAIGNATKNLKNSPRFHAIEGQEDFRVFDDFEQDWETPTSEDINYAREDVKFPKETREAMKVLLRAKQSPRRDRHDHCQKHVTERHGTHWKRRENSRCKNSPLPGNFQQACEHQCQQKLPATSQSRGSRNTDAAVEIDKNGFKADIKNNSKANCENFRVTEFDDLRNQASQETTKFREIVRCRVTTSTMQSNGSESGNSENGVDRTGWTVGLINGKFKYLTAETFGFKINANGASLKKKQLWTLEGSEHQVFLRSHLDRYLAVDQFGNVTCEAEDTSDPGCAFQIQLASDGSGRWALKNAQRGYFLGSSQDELKCMAKAPGEAEYWLVHLAARPQVNLRSAGRKRFAHLSASQDEIHVDAPVPWGEDTLFTLEFRAAATADNEVGPGHGQGGKSEGGHYALHTCNNKYLARDGKLLESCTRDCLYAAEFHAGLLALRDIHGAYLAPIGSKAVLKSRSTTVTRDELFSLEESLPQASFVAALNQRYVSVKQGVDVTANQDEISGHETFQLEFDRVTKRWYVRTMQDRYWSLEAGGGIQASDHKRSSNALFDLVWQPEDGTVALRANNGKFLATKRSGHLYANADSPDSGDSDASKYYFYLMNRPILVLRCEQGFVGPKSAASPKLECNKAGYETIRVERCERGIVRFKGQSGKYWHADSEGVTVDSDLPSAGFYLELREPSRLCIKCTDGRYLTAGKNGALRLGETDHDSATKWEF